MRSAGSPASVPRRDWIVIPASVLTRPAIARNGSDSATMRRSDGRRDRNDARMHPTPMTVQTIVRTPIASSGRSSTR